MNLINSSRGLSPFAVANLDTDLPDPSASCTPLPPLRPAPPRNRVGFGGRAPPLVAGGPWASGSPAVGGTGTGAEERVVWCHWCGAPRR